MDTETCYKILKLRPEATLEEVRNAYKALVKQWHPDRYHYNPQLKAITEKQLQEINLAYEVLSRHLSPSAPIFFSGQVLRLHLQTLATAFRNAATMVYHIVRRISQRLDIKTVLRDLFGETPPPPVSNQRPPRPPSSKNGPSSEHPAFEDIFQQVVDESQPSKKHPKDGQEK